MIRLYNDATENVDAHAEVKRYWVSKIGKQCLPHERLDQRELGVAVSGHNTLLDAFCLAQYSRDCFAEFCTAGQPVLQHEAQQRPLWKPTVLDFCYEAGPTLAHHIVQFAHGWQWRNKCQGLITETFYRRESVGYISSNLFGALWGLQFMGNNAELVQGALDECTEMGISPRFPFSTLASCCRPLSFGFFTPCIAASRITGLPIAVLTASTITSHTPSVATINILTVSTYLTKNQSLMAVWEEMK